MKIKKKTLDRLVIAFMIVILAVGIAIMLYPTLSNYFNSRNQSKAITDYAKTVEKMDESERKKRMSGAQNYNKQLAELASLTIITPASADTTVFSTFPIQV